MKWCEILNMWCQDIEAEEMDSIGCHGDCNICYEMSDIQ